MEPNLGLVYVGKIIAMEAIEGADFIVCATVVCGKGGKWKGVVRKSEFNIEDLCVVFLPDSQLDPEIHSYLPFMKDTAWRVKMRRFKGSPSEVVIVNLLAAVTEFKENQDLPLGKDITDRMQVIKYHKPVPAHLQGKAKGEFPGFIPKTDEPNYQNLEGQLGIEKLIGKPYYITEKADGSSTTAYKYKGQFGLCSRNWELERDENNGYWKVAIQHKLEETLPEGYALQWETCGPKIQGNPHGFTEITGLAFSAYNIQEKRYLNMREFEQFCIDLYFPKVNWINWGPSFSSQGIETLGEGTYKNGKQREGVVVRSIYNELGHKPISFKVINLNYEK